MERIRNNKLGLLLLLTGAVYFFLKYITPLVAPILIAMLFVTIFGTTLKKIQEKLHIPRQLGAMVLLLIALVLVVVLVWVLFSWIVGSMPDWVSRLTVLEENVALLVEHCCEGIGHLVGIDNQYLEQMLLWHLQEGFDYIQLKLLPNMLSHSLTYMKIVASLCGFLVTFVIAAILLAKDYDDIMNGLLEREQYHMLLEIICGVIRYLASFVKAQLAIMSIVGGTAALVLGVAGIRHGILWGMVAGFLDALPFIGTGVVFVPLAIVQLLAGGYQKAVVCMLLYVACIFLRETLEPRLIGKKMGMPPIAVVLSLYAGIRLFGIWGIIKGPLGWMLIQQTYQSLQKR